MAIFSKSTQDKISDAQTRLAAANQELDSLDQLAPPTSDLAVEEEAALRRLARKEALNRVKAALSTELAQLQATLAAEKAEEKRVKVAKAQADIDKSKAVMVEKIWAAYESSEDLKIKCGDLDELMPDFQTRSGAADRYVSQLLGLLVGAGVAKDSTDIMGKRTVTRIKA